MLLHYGITDNNLKWFSTYLSNRKQEAEAAWKLKLIRKIWQVNQIFELILEQGVANYYGDNTIVK